MPRVRRPQHAGSWYSDDAHQLSKEIIEWLGDTEKSGPENPIPKNPVRAIIGPHAGYSYCGPVMAYAYKYIQPREIKRVFLLGPSHHVYSDSCLFSKADVFSTPLGDLKIDKETYTELSASVSMPDFDYISLSADEDEHSLEMHVPFLVQRFVQESCPLPRFVPIVVGNLSTEQELQYGAALAPYLADPSTLFVISSDFCHWGSRFGFTFHDKSQGDIASAIEWLDRQGMESIASGDPLRFAGYLKSYRNTICGRHPIGVLLGALKALGARDPAPVRHRITFTRYAQSSRCTKPSDSSVSYASAVVTLT